VTVTTPPAITTANSTICSGGSAVLTASGPLNGFTWSPATNLNQTTGASVTSNPTVALTTYTITGFTSGCTNVTGTVSVAVTTPPPIITSNKTICSGGSVTLTASGPTSYSWSPAATLNQSI